jgi:hypothetical protein
VPGGVKVAGNGAAEEAGQAVEPNDAHRLVHARLVLLHDPSPISRSRVVEQMMWAHKQHKGYRVYPL